MLQYFIDRIFRSRHFWRRISFDEVAELYTSRLMTIFAQNIVMLFAAVYLWKIGYSIEFISLFYAIMYLGKVPLAPLAGKFTAYYGPKHAILAGNLFRIPSLASFALVPEFGMVAIVAFAIFQAFSTNLYDIGHMVVFSKVRSIEHTGRELGYMAIIEKIARVVSPVIGGFVAVIWSPTAVIILAGTLFALASLPLFRTVEPTATRSKFSLSGFPWHRASSMLLAQVGAGIDYALSNIVWTLFISAVVFAAMGDMLYATIGGLASIGVCVSLIASWTFGKLIDKNKSNGLIAVGAIGKSILGVFRPFVGSPMGVLGTNIVSETATSAYAMSLMRETFDAADSSGARIPYMTLIEMMLNLGAALTCFVWFLAIQQFGESSGFGAVFMFSIAGVLLIMAAQNMRK